MTLIRFNLLLSILFLPTINSIAQNKGKELFELHCASCHNFKQDGIGPHLGGLKESTDNQYLTDMIRNPQKLIDTDNIRAVEKLNKFKVLMPSFGHLKSKEIQDIIAFILEQPAPRTASKSGRKPLENPIIEPIEQSGITLNLQKVIQFPFTDENAPHTRINKTLVHPLTKETLFADLQGKIYILNSQNQVEVFFDAQQNFKNFINKPGLATGLGSFAFHPEFAKNRLFYTTHTEPAKSAKADFAYADSIPVKMQWVVTEWLLDDVNARVLKGKSREMMRVNVVTQIHGMQEIAFNPYAKPNDEDYGLLYICIGDGGAVENGYPFIASNKNQVWGKILRIDPLGKNSKNGQYGIPKTNPYIGKRLLDEIYTGGFRNPNRITWLQDGRAIVSNIGHHKIESLYLLKPAQNHGWPDREGAFEVGSSTKLSEIFPLPKNDTDYTYPIAQYDHDEGNAVMGGFEYLGNEIAGLKGKYVFGDITKGRVFYLNIDEIKEGEQAKIREFQLAIDGKKILLKDLYQHFKVDLRFGQDANGDIYLITKPDGMMYRIVK